MDVWIKEIAVTNFRSYADVTVGPFHPGVNAIVGPNGSGKSNFLRALRFALTNAYIPAKNHREFLRRNCVNNKSPHVKVTVARRRQGPQISPSDSSDASPSSPDSGTAEVEEVVFERWITGDNRDCFGINGEESCLELYSLAVLRLGFPFFAASLFIVGQDEAFLVSRGNTELTERTQAVVRSKAFIDDVELFHKYIAAHIPDLIRKMESGMTQMQAFIEKLHQDNLPLRIARLDDEILAHDYAVGRKECEEIEALISALDAQHSVPRLADELEDAKARLKECEDRYEEKRRACKRITARLLEREQEAKLLSTAVSGKFNERRSVELELAALTKTPSPPLEGGPAPVPASSGSTQEETVQKYQRDLEDCKKRMKSLLENMQKSGFDPLDPEFVYVSPENLDKWQYNLETHIKKTETLEGKAKEILEELNGKLEETRKKVTDAEQAFAEGLAEKERTVEAGRRAASNDLAAAQREAGRLLTEKQQTFLKLKALEKEISERSNAYNSHLTTLARIYTADGAKGIESMTALVKTLKASGRAEDRKLVEGYLGLVVDEIEVSRNAEIAVCTVAGKRLWHHVVRTVKEGVDLGRKFNGMRLEGSVRFVCLDVGRNDVSFVPEDVDNYTMNVRRLEPLVSKNKDLANILFGRTLICSEFKEVQGFITTKSHDHWAKRVDWVSQRGELYRPRFSTVVPTPYSRVKPIEFRRAMKATEEALARAETEQSKLRSHSADIERRIEENAKKIEELTDACSQFDLKADALLQQRGTLSEDIADLREDEQRIRREIESTLSTLATLPRTLSNLRQALANPPTAPLTDDERDELKESYAAEADAAKELHALLEEAKSRLFNRESSARAESEGRERSVTDMDEHRRAYEAKKRVRDGVAREYDDLVARGNAVDAEIKELQSARQTAKDEEIEAKAALDAAQMEHTRCEERANDVGSREALLERREAAVDKMAACRSRISSDAQRAKVERAVEALTRHSMKRLVEARRKLSVERDRLARDMAADLGGNAAIAVENLRIETGALEQLVRKVEASRQTLDDFCRGLPESMDEVICKWNSGVHEFLRRWEQKFNEIFRGCQVSHNFIAELQTPVENRIMDAVHLTKAGIKISKPTRTTGDGDGSDADAEAGSGGSGSGTGNAAQGSGSSSDADNGVVSENALSSGQKSLLTFTYVTSLFAALGVPTLALDEIDQSLDQTHRSALTRAAKKVSGKEIQFLATTFSPEIAAAADACFRVHPGNASRVESIDNAEAHNFIRNFSRSGEIADD